jgi:tetratricopeptide (TPR) repeat protein
MKQYETALMNDQENYKIYQHMAWCTLKMDKPQQAISYANQAEELMDDQSNTLYIKGRCHLAMNNLDEAHKCFQEAADKFPGEPAYWTSLAMIYFLREDYGKAFENIIKATSLNTFKGEIWFNLGVLYERCRQPEEAKIAYQKAIEICQGDEESKRRIQTINSNQSYMTYQHL